MAGVDKNASLFPTGGSRTAVSVRIIGVANPDRNRATFNIWVGLPGDDQRCAVLPSAVSHDDRDGGADDRCGRAGITRYRIRTGDPAPEAARSTVRDIDRIFENGDWPGLYKQLAPSVAAGVPQAQLVSMMQGQNIGKITSATTAGDGKWATTTGISYWSQTIRLRVQPISGPPVDYTTNLFLVFEHGQWRLLSTATPQPAR